MKRFKNEGNPLAFGDPKSVATLAGKALSRPMLSEEEHRNACKLGKALESGDQANVEEVIGRQVELAKSSLGES